MTLSIVVISLLIIGGAIILYRSYTAANGFVSASQFSPETIR